jgi:photosystem II stability/assembly factor-like uncharacterized protein
MTRFFKCIFRPVLTAILVAPLLGLASGAYAEAVLTFTIADKDGTPPQTDIAVDPKSGQLYAVWQDKRFSEGRFRRHDSIALSTSTDGGLTWTKLDIEFPEFCAGVSRPRILTICVQPERATEVWFGVEEGGAWRSSDAGDTWQRVDTPDSKINNADIHCIAILPASDRKPVKHLVLTVNAVWESEDDGRTWDGALSRDRFDGLYYTRTVHAVDKDGDELVLAVGDGTPGTRTRIYRSNDRGKTWAPTVLHTAPNSTVWAFGAHPSDRSLLFAGTKYGHLLRSVDGGRAWFKEWRDFSEITSVAWTPFVAAVKAHPQSVT